jgi:hypothetical protein
MAEKIQSHSSLNAPPNNMLIARPLHAIASSREVTMTTPPQPYTDNFDALVALLTHLANTDRESRTVPNMARDLGLDEHQVRKVLQQFTGLFRKSRTVDKKNGEPFYTVHLRYARRKRDGATVPTEPLKPSELSTLLDLVLKMVARENEMSKLYVELKQRGRTLIVTNIVTMIAALLAALVAITTAFIRR